MSKEAPELYCLSTGLDFILSNNKTRIFILLFKLLEEIGCQNLNCQKCSNTNSHMWAEHVTIASKCVINRTSIKCISFNDIQVNCSKHSASIRGKAESIEKAVCMYVCMFYEIYLLLILYPTTLGNLQHINLLCIKTMSKIIIPKTNYVKNYY